MLFFKCSQEIKWLLNFFELGFICNFLDLFGLGNFGFGFCVKVGNLDFGEGEYWIPAFAGMTIVSGNDNVGRES